MGVKFERKKDGTLFVPGILDLSNHDLSRLPDLSMVEVEKSFICSTNRLTSLKGAPKIVGGSFLCFGNGLTSLDHAPQRVGGDFVCGSNSLRTLAGGPAWVGGDYYCWDNKLTSLEGAAQHVGGDFNCSYNNLKTLEHLPADCQRVSSDFGSFASAAEVPLALTFPPEAQERLAREQRRAVEEQAHAATVLKSAIRVGRPIRFRRD